MKEDVKEIPVKNEQETSAAVSDIKEPDKGVELKETPEKKKGHKIAILTTILCLSAILLAYFGIAGYFTGRFFPGTTINGMNCGNLTVEETTEKWLRSHAEQYSLTLLDREGNELIKISAQDIHIDFSDDGSISRILENQNALAWIVSIWGKTDIVTEITVTPEYDAAALKNMLEQAGLFSGEEKRKPQDAYISEYSEEIKGYTIISEKEGDIFDEETTLFCVEEALKKVEAQLDLAAAKCYEQPEITSENPELLAELEELNKVVGTCITYDWNGSEEVLDGDLIHEWLVWEDGVLALDREQVAAYVAQKAKENDTYGKKRKFLTTLGVELTLPSGAYGWKTDRAAETDALMELIMDGTVTEREPEYSCKGWVKGKDDIGNSYVEVDLSNQHLYLYEDGELVLETDFVSGNVARGNSTPAGVFGITYKKKDAVLRGRDYETPVNYWMPFNGNIGMHDATWRRSFGGEIYLTNGSHGCINLPLDMAAAIYEHVQKGFPVICYYY